MKRGIVVHDIPLEDIAEMERWYFRYHAPEIIRRYGPWLQRFESWLPVQAPAEAQAYGLFNWRVTHSWWREIPEAGPQGTLAFTVPPVRPCLATCFIAPQPTQDFMGSDIQPDEKNVLRWFCLMRYPEGVSEEEGEHWFLHTHVPEVMRQPGLYRFFSHKVLKEQVRLPGTWKPGTEPPPGTAVRNWVRVNELWYDNFRDWRRAVIEQPPAYTAPAWAMQPAYPFLTPKTHFASSFLLERPNDDFLRDSRAILM